MTNIELDRLYEVIFYQYFNNKTTEQLQSVKFWNTINALCEAYEIDPVQITKIIRTLSNPDNKATDLETYYLLSKINMSVRKINRLTGIYWQKQVSLSKKIETEGAPPMRRHITDIIAKNSLKEFIHAMYDVFGVLQEIDVNALNCT